VFYDRDFHGIVLVYDASNPKSKQSISRWSEEFLSFRARHHAPRQYPELHVANKADCVAADSLPRLTQSGQATSNVWHMAASSNSSNADGNAVSSFLRFIEHLSDLLSV
jgi:GTPase SAR1 family protein